MRLKMKKRLEKELLPTSKTILRDIENSQKLKQRLAIHYYQAFHGTTDDEGENAEDWQKEIVEVFKGKYGEVLTAHSYYVEKEGKIVASILITMFRGVPLIIFLAVDQSARRQGLGKLLLIKTCQSLSDDYQDVFLAVHSENRDARALYESLDFEYVGTDWDKILPTS